MIDNITLKSAIEVMFGDTNDQVDLATKEAFLSILNVRNSVSKAIADVVIPKYDIELEDELPVEETPDDDSTVPAFNSQPKPLEKKEVKKFMNMIVRPVTNLDTSDAQLLTALGFQPAEIIDFAKERKKIYVTAEGIKVAFAKGSHGAYGNEGPTVNKTTTQIEIYNTCDYWVHARYQKGVSGYVDGAAFDIRNSKLQWEGGEVSFTSKTEAGERIDNKTATWFKVKGLDKIEVDLTN